jgi:ABC-type multidrug transport system fused ATPase/permease subunit
MESLANQIEHQTVPQLKAALQKWKKRVLWVDLVTLATLLVAFMITSIVAGYWQGLSFNPPWLAAVQGKPLLSLALIGGVLLLFGAFHFYIRNVFSKSIAKTLSSDSSGNVKAAFLKSTGFFRSVFQRNPKGWGRRTQKKLTALRDDTDRFVQKINDRFTQPSG